MNLFVKKKNTELESLEAGKGTELENDDVMEYIRKRNPKKKKKVIRAVIIITILVLAAGGIGLSIVNAQSGGLQVSTVSVGKGDVEQIIDTSGTVETENQKIYYADVAAPIEQLNLEAGTTVSAGQLLLVYDTTDLELEQRKSALDETVSKKKLQIEMEKGNTNEADYATASTNLTGIDAQIADLETKIEQVHCMITSNKKWTEDEGAKLQDDISELKAERESVSTNKAKNKIDDKIDDKQEEINNHSTTDLEEYLRQGEDQLAKLKEQKSNNESDQTTAENGILTGTEKSEIGDEVKLAEVTAESANVNLNRAKAGVSADFAGIVSDVKAVEGSMTAGGTELFTVADTDHVKVVMQVTKFNLEYLQVGQSADITIAGHDYTGTVTKIDKAAKKNDSGTSVINADIHIDNPDAFIYLGVEAKVVIHIAESKQTLVVPVEVVNTDETGYYCYVINNGIIERRNLELGISSDTYTEILGGLKEGDQVISDSSIDVVEGMSATAVSEQMEEKSISENVSTDEATVSADAE